jgi:transposase
MGLRLVLNDRQWAKVEAFLRQDAGRGMGGKNDRRFVEAVLWWRRTGVPWRDLPEAFGPWKTVFNSEWHSLDSTIHRAHQHAAGAKKTALTLRKALASACGGFSTKVHRLVDALGMPVCFEVTEGQRHDTHPASALMARGAVRCLLADKAYDSDALRAQLIDEGAQAVIPPKANRLAPAAFDKELYKARSEVERTFNLLKQARRFATRYEKTLRNYVSVVAVGCAWLWLLI